MRATAHRVRWWVQWAVWLSVAAGPALAAASERSSPGAKGGATTQPGADANADLLRRARLAYTAGEKHWEDRQWEKAIARYREALSLYRRHCGERDHADVARCLRDIALCLHVLGRLGEALPLFQQHLAMQKRLHRGQDHADVAWSLHRLVFCVKALGRPAEALPLCRQALAMWRRLYEERDHPRVAASLNYIAQCLHDLGRLGEAMPLFQQALAMQKRLHKDRDHRDVPVGLNNLATCLYRLGRLGEALPLFQQALAMHKRIWKDQDHPDVAWGLNNLASCLRDLGRCEQALPLYHQSLAMRKRLHKGQDHPDLAVSLNNVAYCLDALARPGEALPLYQQALAMQKRIWKDHDHPQVAVSLNNLAFCLHAVGRPAEALPRHQQAVAMAERLGDPDAWKWASGLGWQLLRMGRPLEAAKAFEKAVAGMEAARRAVGGTDVDRSRYFAHAQGWGVIAGMVRAQRLLGRPDKALEYLERGRALGLRDVLERGRALGGKDLAGYVLAKAQAEGNRKLQEEAQAAKAAEQSAWQRVAERTAEVSLLRGRKDLAEPDRRKRIDAKLAELRAAQEAYVSARRVVFNLVAKYVSGSLGWKSAGQIRSFLGARERLVLYSVGEKQTLLVLVPPAGTGQDIRVMELRWPGGQQDEDGPAVTRESLSEAVARYASALIYEGLRAAGAEPERMSKEQLRSRGVRRPVASYGSAKTAQLGHRLFRALVPAPVCKELCSADRVYVVPDGALHRLPLETLVVEAPDAQRASPAKRTHWLDAGPALVYGPSATVLMDRAEARRKQREQAASGSRPLREAALLGDPVFQRGRRPQAHVPASGVVVAEVSPGSPAERAGLRGGSVITHYDGKPVGSAAAFTKVRNAFALAQMDAETPREASLRFWRQGSVLEVSVPHGKVGVRVRDLSEALRQRLARGEPMDASAQLGAVLRSGYLGRYGALTPLPGTRREVEQIRRTLLGGREKPGAATGIAVLLGEDATLAALYEAARGSRYLHLATHGLIDETDRAIYSSLALAQPQPREVTARNFGFLTLADLLDQWWGRLGMTELVVLSACETQRGRLESGEGVFGLSWGFMFAGAPAVVASLWQVNDASTAELMSDFYARLEAARGEAQSKAPGAARGRSTTKLDAFLAARKALRKKHAEPFFWAPFIYIGDPR